MVAVLLEEVGARPWECKNLVSALSPPTVGTRLVLSVLSSSIRVGGSVTLIYAPSSIFEGLSFGGTIGTLGTPIKKLRLCFLQRGGPVIAISIQLLEEDSKKAKRLLTWRRLSGDPEGVGSFEKRCDNNVLQI